MSDNKITNKLKLAANRVRIAWKYGSHSERVRIAFCGLLVVYLPLAAVGGAQRVSEHNQRQAYLASSEYAQKKANEAITQCVRIYEMAENRQAYCDVIDPAKATGKVAEYIGTEQFAAYKKQVDLAYEAETEARMEKQRAADQLALENRARGILRRAEEYNQRVYAEECRRGVRSVYDCVK